MKNLLTSTVVCAALLISASGAQAESKQCLPIGGTALGKVYGGNQIMGAMSGTWTGARGEIKDETKTETKNGFDIEMEHFFITGDGGIVKTRDKAEFTAVPGKDQTSMLEIAYTVAESEGPLAGYSGTFYSFGLIKMGEGSAVVRYSGEICK